MDLNLELYRKLYLIRRAEETIRKYYFEDRMKTPMHMSMGGEANAVGVCHALSDEDQVFGSYRSHAIYLAKTQDIDDFLAEMYGKDTALLKGKGGSMHLCAPAHGFMGTSAIVASSIPVAVGAAFANKQNKNDHVVAVFFGDGALNEGDFWESINLACLKKIPVLFVCEDNDLAVHTFKYERNGYDSITDVISNFNIDVYKNSSTDVEVIYNLSKDAIDSVRKTHRPCFINLEYYRYLEHVGVNDDFGAGYRSEVEFLKWYEVDPIKIQRDKLVSLGFANDLILSIETEIDGLVNDSMEKAEKAPFADLNELYKGVYS